MFSRWWPWGRTKQEIEQTSVAPAPLAVSRVTPVVAAPAAALFFDELARMHAADAPIAPEEEPAITELVLRLVDYGTRKKIDPPVMPALVPRVLAVVNEPEVNIVGLAGLIEQDLALSAKLLSVANSPAFGGSIEIKTVRKAISLLGTEQVAQVAIGLACSSSYEPGEGGDATLRARWARLFRHGMTTAFSASHLAGSRNRAEQEAAFLGGLFHDVGKAVALRALEVLVRGGLVLPSELAVDEALHRVHAYPGEEFYAKWTFPQTIMAICTHHHQLDELHDAPRVLHLVSLASSFDALLAGGASERRTALLEARTSADRLALGEAELSAAFTQTRAFGERSQRMLAG